MKLIQLLFAILLLSSLNIKAQMAKGYKKGTIVLADSTHLSGYVKDNMASDASISIMTENTEKKIKYTGSDILSTEIDGKKFLCLKGDFFQIITSGDLTFLKKMSNASSKPVYNGTEAIFITGSEGRQGDYFIYDSALKQLLLVNRKNKERII